MFFDFLFSNELSLIICAILIVLALLSCFADSFFRKIHENEYRNEELLPVSVIIVSDNNALELKKNLPVFLSQDYPQGYEVIVVVCKDEDGTEDVIKTFGEHENLHVTFVPKSARYMSTHKLAITLGVKAAKNEWILLTDADCLPVSDKWIATMASNCASDRNLVFGYSNYNEDTSSFKRFFRLHCEYSNMRQASKSYGYGMFGSNLMFRKSMFMDDKGFQGNLKYARGEYYFLVNKYGDEEVIAVDLTPESYIEEEKPTKKEWRNKNVFYMETRKHLNHRLRHRFVFNLDMLSLHLCFWLSIAAFIYAVLTLDYIIIAGAVIAIICPLIVRTVTASRAFRLFNANIPLICVIPFEFHLVFHNLKYKLKYKFADKTAFICHKF
ncbi:MAG: glycosyltransferase [Prevotella sp.]|nr:glycosyltransferase [Prevotella sp.]